MRAMNKNKNKFKKKKNVAHYVVFVKTKNEKTVSMKQIMPSEINALRNSAYEYLT